MTAETAMTDPSLRYDAVSPLPGEEGARLVARVWLPGDPPGPAVVAVRDGRLVDLSRHAPTMSALLERDDLLELVEEGEGPVVGELAEVVHNSRWDRRLPERPWLLAPCDLQAVKAAGVTFVRSLLERVVEEQARGDPARAAEVRAELEREIGGALSGLRPGTPQADRLRQALEARGRWSQYLEVGLGPDAEIFTKAQPMAAVGHGALVGVHPRSRWNNPEPELVLAVDSRGRIRAATLGNDVNLRDFEGRSALLLGRAKDNNASCAIGPFLRLIDDRFPPARLRDLTIHLEVSGEDGFRLEADSAMADIARDPEELVAQTLSPVHDYPDGLVLFLGTPFAPVQDRDAPGMGFTHHPGDVVTIRSEALGALVNRVDSCERVPRWEFGVRALMHNLAARGLLGPS